MSKGEAAAVDKDMKDAEDPVAKEIEAKKKATQDLVQGECFIIPPSL